MSFRRVNFLALLILGAGFFIPLAVLAGDKIQFSDAATTLEVPRVQREEKISVNSSLEAPLAPDAAVMAEQMQSSGGVIYIPGPKKKNERSRDTDIANDRDVADREENPYDTLTRKPSLNDFSTNSLNTILGLNHQPGGIYSDRAADISDNPDSLRARVQALHTGEKIDYERDERYGRQPIESDDTTGISHHGLFGLGTTDGNSRTSDAEMKSVNDGGSQTYTLTRPFNAADELLRESKMPPGMVEYNSEVSTLRGKTPDEAMSQSLRPYHPAETRAGSATPDPYARQEPPASPPGQVQSRPGILPFPKRPGSVFQ
jgi:hypothetical protein